MLWSMSTPDLNPVSYVVLGLVARDGPSTAYELKVAVGRGIARMWPFPHSQIYSESKRLAELGLLTEEEEHTGRRRRTYQITDEGRAALTEWLAEPTADAPQFRSLGILKLFFGQFASHEDIVQLSKAEVEMYDELLDQLHQLVDRLKSRGDRPWQLAVGEMAIATHEALREQWELIAELPPTKMK
jgi:PadR family transcriptional regulator AphA